MPFHQQYVSDVLQSVASDWRSSKQVHPLGKVLARHVRNDLRELLEVAIVYLVRHVHLESLCSGSKLRRQAVHDLPWSAALRCRGNLIDDLLSHDFECIPVLRRRLDSFGDYEQDNTAVMDTIARRQVEYLVGGEPDAVDQGET